MNKTLRVAFDNIKKNFQLENTNNFYYSFGYVPKTNKNVFNHSNNDDIFYYGFGYMPIKNKKTITICNSDELNQFYYGFGHVKINNK